MERRRYRQYLTCPEKDIPKRSERRYRADIVQRECGQSVGPDGGMSGVDTDLKVEPDEVQDSASKTLKSKPKLTSIFRLV